MQARYYDPVIGRFLSNDPVGFAQGEVAYFNGYAYTANDPVNMVDPDGRQQRFFSFADDNRADNRRIRMQVGSPENSGDVISNAVNQLEINLAITSNEIAIGLENAANATANLGVFALLAPPTSRGASAVGGVFAQRTFREAFSKQGARVLSEITGQSITKIDDLAGVIQSGAVNASDIPIEVISRGGRNYILNTRTATALDRAGVSRSQFNVIDQTGNAAAEARLSGQLERNGFTPPNGCTSPQSTGC